jgi:E3 ubiquitin-protein ligase BRE1
VQALEREALAARDESRAYAAEVDELARAYEEQQSLNAALLDRQGELDASAAAVADAQLAARQRVEAAEESARAAREDAAAAKREAEGLRELREGMERDLQAVRGRVLELQGALDQQRAAREQAERGARLKQGECEQLQLRAQAAEGRLVGLEKELSGAVRERDDERAKRARAESDAAAAKEQAKRSRRAAAAGGASGTGGEVSGDVQQLQAALDGMRKVIKCGVCHTNDKDTVILKCMHVFCGDCVRSNLETRHRKCPGCGLAFGAADVKAVYL